MKISTEGIETIEDNIEKVKKFPLKIPRSQYVHSLAYVILHLKDYSILASPLYELTKIAKRKVSTN